ASAAKIVPLLEKRLAELSIAPDVDRAVTARSAAMLCAELQGKRGVEQVKVLAWFEARTSAKAVGNALATSADTAVVLDNKILFNIFGRLPHGNPAADAVIRDVKHALTVDEL